MSVPYGVIADCLKHGTVAPFLGAGASFAGAPPETAMPIGASLAKRLIQMSGAEYPGSESDPLTKITQYLEETPADRTFLLRGICNIFYQRVPDGYRCSVSEFLSNLPRDFVPKLIVTTNYDVVLERTFEGKIPYLALSQMMRNTKYAGRLLCYDSLAAPFEKCILTRSQVEEALHDLDRERPGCVLIYKMHGTARLDFAAQLLDSIVLTESDYIEFLEEDRLNKIPTRILRERRRANLLFLGYSLEDWNFRVLLQRLHKIQQKEQEGVRRHWAFRKMDQPDEVEVKFWEKRGVNLYSLPLEDFLAKLREFLPSRGRADASREGKCTTFTPI